MLSSIAAWLPWLLVVMLVLAGSILFFGSQTRWERQKQILIEKAAHNREWRENIKKLEDTLDGSELSEDALIQIIITLKKISGAHRAALFFLDVQKANIHAIGEKEDLEIYSDAKTFHISEGRLPLIIKDLQPQIYDFYHPSREDLATNREIMAQNVFADGNRSGLDVPIYFNREVFGKISLMFDRYVDWTDEKIEFFADCGQLIGWHINYTHLSDTLRELAILRERNYLSRELHDNLSQLISALDMQAEAAWLSYEKDEKVKLGIGLSGMIETTKVIQAGLREEMLGLRIGVDHDDDLFHSIRACAERFQQGSDITIHLEDQCSPGSVIASPGVIAQLTRILQEGLSNVRRHSKATQVVIRMGEFSQILFLEIEDDGLGFDVEGVREGHLGLQIMRERAKDIGGNIIIRSAEGCGTCIRVELPTSQFLCDFCSPNHLISQ